MPFGNEGKCLNPQNRYAFFNEEDNAYHIYYFDEESYEKMLERDRQKIYERLVEDEYN